MHTRRDFGKIALAALPVAAPLSVLRGAARIHSTVGGVKLGAISYCFRVHREASRPHHPKDRKRNDGPNMPWGEGETPLKQALTLIKEKHYPIYCVIEYEYKGTGTPIEETKKCMAYMRAALV